MCDNNNVTAGVSCGDVPEGCYDAVEAVLMAARAQTPDGVNDTCDTRNWSPNNTGAPTRAHTHSQTQTMRKCTSRHRQANGNRTRTAIAAPRLGDRAPPLATSTPALPTQATTAHQCPAASLLSPHTRTCSIPRCVSRRRASCTTPPAPTAAAMGAAVSAARRRSDE